MRIAVIGDFHIHVEELELTERAMHDINQTKPDLVVALGDLGCQKHIGHISGIKQSFDLLKLTGARVRPILGNHDLQRESGTGLQAKGTMEAEMKEWFHLESAYSVEEYPAFRLFFLSCDPQPELSCYQIQECYISDRQFEWFKEKLAERPGIRAIVFTHAPPLGSGLRTVPDVHVRATNAYLDQNHDPHRWEQLIHSYPQILLWFSAHYHLSHDYSDSHSVVGHTNFFMTGVHSNASRDGKRQSRMIDILDDGVKVSTIDHSSGCMRKKPDWQRIGDMDNLEHSEMKRVSEDGYSAAGDGCWKYAEVPVGTQGNGSNQIVVINERLCYLATEEGYLWEAEPVHRSVMGTLHKGSPVTGAIQAEQLIWWACGNKISAASMVDPWRFARHRGDGGPLTPPVWEMPACPTLFAKGAGKEVWAACHGALVRLDSVPLPISYSLPPDIGKPVKLMMSNSTALWILSETGALWRYSITKEQAEYISDGWLDWDMHNDSMAGIAEGNNPVIYWWTEGNVWSIRVDQLVNGNESLFVQTDRPYSVLSMGEGPIELHSSQNDYEVSCLNERALLIRIRGFVYFFRQVSSSAITVTTGEALAIAGASAPSNLLLFAVYKQVSSPNDYPLLELWKYGHRC